ncbi:MAG: MBL fold metallo-hydrolase [Planctomycetota bacterium]
MRIHAAAFAGGLLLALVTGQEAEPKSAPERDERPLAITYLANEGVLLARGETKVLIDACLQTPYSIYAALPEEVHADLAAGRKPFDGLDLALASHVHRDHVQPASARAVLAGNPALALASSPQVIAAVGEELVDDDPLRERLVELLPEPGKWRSYARGPVRLECFLLPHSGVRHASVQNLAHLVDVGGLRVLHLGDAEASRSHLVPMGLKEREVDVACVPYWWLLSDSGKELIEAEIAPRVTVAVHVPPGELEQVRTTLRRNAPEVVVFGEPLQTRLVAPE